MYWLFKLKGEQQTPRAEEAFCHHGRPPPADEHLQHEGGQDLRFLLSRLIRSFTSSSEIIQSGANLSNANLEHFL
jgi:hypothetical protein